MQDIFLVGDTYYIRCEYGGKVILWSGSAYLLNVAWNKEEHTDPGNCLRCIRNHVPELAKRINSVLVEKGYTGYKPKSGLLYAGKFKLTGPDVASKSHNLPGIKEKVDCPLDSITKPGEPCSIKDTPLHSVIMHLNDEHKWPRESIAQWVGSLPFDTTFKKKEPPTSESWHDVGIIQSKSIQDDSDIF